MMAAWMWSPWMWLACGFGYVGVLAVVVALCESAGRSDQMLDSPRESLVLSHGLDPVTDEKLDAWVLETYRREVFGDRPVLPYDPETLYDREGDA